EVPSKRWAALRAMVLFWAKADVANARRTSSFFMRSAFYGASDAAKTTPARTSRHQPRVGMAAMSESEELLSRALRLPDHDRAELARRLLESLDADRSRDVNEAWLTEIE